MRISGRNVAACASPSTAPWAIRTRCPFVSRTPCRLVAASTLSSMTRIAAARGARRGRRARVGHQTGDPRERDRHLGAAPHARAGDGHLSPRAAPRAHGTVASPRPSPPADRASDWGPGERLEEVVDELGRDAGAGVEHPQQHPVALDAHHHLDAAAAGRELQPRSRAGSRDLHEPGRVHLDAGAGGEPRLEGDPGRPEGGVVILDRRRTSSQRSPAPAGGARACRARSASRRGGRPRAVRGGSTCRSMTAIRRFAASLPAGACWSR